MAATLDDVVSHLKKINQTLKRIKGGKSDEDIDLE
jgi:hypothetical protein